MRALTPSVRRWLYGVALAVVPILVAYGIVDGDRAPLWVALVSAVIVPGVALANVQDERSSAQDPEQNFSDYVPEHAEDDED